MHFTLLKDMQIYQHRDASKTKYKGCGRNCTLSAPKNGKIICFVKNPQPRGGGGENPLLKRKTYLAQVTPKAKKMVM